MSKLSKTLWMAAAAAVGAGVTYYVLKKDEIDFEGFASDIVKSTKEFGEVLTEDFTNHFNEAEEAPEKTSPSISTKLVTQSSTS